MSRAFRGEVAALRATLVAAQGDLARTIDLAQTALAALPTEDVLTRGTVAISLGIACAQNGAGESASRAFGEARAIYQAVNNLYGTMLTTHGLGLVAILHGRPRAAGTLYEETLRDAERAGQSGAPILGLAHLGLAELAYEWNDKLAVGRRIEAVARARALKLLP